MSTWLDKLTRERDMMRSLYQRVASMLLAPDGALVRWQDSYIGSENGGISRDENGKLIIDISESLPLDEQYKVFLHEVSHGLDESHVIKRSHYHRLPPAQKTFSYQEHDMRRAEPVRKRLEATADAIASELTSYANAHAYEYLRYDEPVLFARLRALAEPQARLYIKAFTKSFLSEMEKIR